MEKAVIFDLDGTVLDTLKDIAENINVMLSHFGYENLSDREIMQYIGNGARKLVERSVKVKLTDSELNERYKFYDQLYTSAASEKTCVFEGLKEVIFALKERGYKLAILTNKQQSATDTVCNKYLKDFGFDLIVGQREGVPIKPDPTAVINIMKELGANPKETYFIGDGETDVMTAINAKITGVAVLWGYREKY